LDLNSDRERANGQLAQGIYEFATLMVASWVIAQAAQWPSLITFLLLNLAGVCVFNSRVAKRRRALSRPLTWGLTIVALALTPLFPVLLLADTAGRMRLAVALGALVAGRLLMVPPAKADA
jgi:membrane-associated phospholipid phosphatase